MIEDVIRALVAEAVAASEARIIAAVVAEIRAARPVRLVSVAQAAAELGISACSIRRRIADGSLPSRRLGGRVLVDLSAIQPHSDDEIARLARAARGGSHD